MGGGAFRVSVARRHGAVVVALCVVADLAIDSERKEE